MDQIIGKGTRTGATSGEPTGGASGGDGAQITGTKHLVDHSGPGPAIMAASAFEDRKSVV